MTHIAIFDPLSRHGGIHYYVHDQANALVAHGVTVDVFCPPTGLEHSATYSQHVAFEGVYGAGGTSNLARGYRLTRDLARVARNAKMRGATAIVLHIFKSDIFETLAILLARAYRLRVFAIVHDVTRLDTNARISFSSFIIRRVSGVVVHNEFSRDALLNTAPAAHKKTCVIPHGNYVDRFPAPPEMADARIRLELPSDVFILLFFGNPRREKGLAVLLQAMTHFAKRTDILLLVAGKMKPHEEAETRAFIAEHRLDQVTRLDIGHVPDDRIADYYCAASIVVLPYLRVYESGVALMAMSFARALLVSDLPVFKDIVHQSAGGVTFVSGSSADLARVIGEFLSKTFDPVTMGEHGADFAIRHRSWTKSGALLGDFIG